MGFNSGFKGLSNTPVNTVYCHSVATILCFDVGVQSAYLRWKWFCTEESRRNVFIKHCIILRMLLTGTWGCAVQ